MPQCSTLTCGLAVSLPVYRMGTTLPAENDENVVLVTTVEIAPGFSRPIRLRSGDSATEKALEFCIEFCLSAEVAAPLARHLQDNLEKATVRISSFFSSVCGRHEEQGQGHVPQTCACLSLGQGGRECQLCSATEQFLTVGSII
jgi:hypothetical protein